jgi:hypothetical protein
MNASEWFHLIGLISAAALGVGFVAGLVSVGLSWKVNQDQKLELEKIKTGVNPKSETTS